MNLIRKAFTNKTVFYVFTRYIVYSITFISSMILAAKMGPYYFGIWGAVLLLLNYFHIFDLGIGNSVTVFLVKHKTNDVSRNDYELSAMGILAFMVLMVLGISGVYFCCGAGVFEKYHLGNRFYMVCLIAILQYYNDYFLRVSRVKGKMAAFTFYQSITQILVLLVAIFVKASDQLIDFLIGAYLISHVVSAVFFICKGGISFKGTWRFLYAKEILIKGFFLFCYNFFFYMIIVSTKSIIGYFYSVDDFGLFSFSYTLAHAALLLLSAFSSLIFPKLIDKFNSDDNENMQNMIRMVRNNYVFFSYGVMFLAMAFFPVVLYFIPKYSQSLVAVNLTSLSVLLYSNSFGFLSFLMAQNKEKQLAACSLVSLLINIIVSFVLVRVVLVQYAYLAFSIMLSYLFFSYFIVYYGKRFLGRSCGFVDVINEVLPYNLLIPYIIAIIFTFFNNAYLMLIPFLVFSVINRGEIRLIIDSIKRIIANPSVVDIH